MIYHSDMKTQKCAKENCKLRIRMQSYKTEPMDIYCFKCRTITMTITAIEKYWFYNGRNIKIDWEIKNDK